MSLVFVTNNFTVDPSEVASIEYYEHYSHSGSPSGSSTFDHDGVIVTQKNGRKTYLKDLTVKRCHELIFGKMVKEIQEPK